jgi:RNA polymerase sigma factor (sigma-70 family)
VQEVRIALWRAGSERLINATWLVRTAQHKAVDQLRKSYATAIPRRSECSAPSADREVFHLLRVRVSRLPERLRRFYQLRFEAGLTEREIAAHLGVSRSSVRRMHRRCISMIAGEGVK